MLHTFNTKKMIKDFGGRTQTALKLRQHGFDITVDGIDKWNKRSSVPFKALTTLQVIAKNEKIRFDMMDYIEPYT